MDGKRLAVVATSVALLLSMIALPAHATTLIPTAVAAPCTITGTSGADRLVGTRGSDVICGLGGNDIIRGGEGNDIIRGGEGNDSIEGGAGNDSIEGGEGNDKLVGGTGDDLVLGGEGRDNLSSETGDDALNGGGGVDSVRSGPGDDTCANDAADRRLDSCNTDSEAPLISFPASNNSQIQAGSTVVFRWVARDASGVTMTWGQVGGPPGWIDWCGFATPAVRIDGTTEAGSYELRCDIPSTAVNERYTLYIGAADSLGNSLPNWAGFEFTVLNGSSDNQVPDIREVRLPATLRVGDTFTVDIDVTDESGTAGVYSWFLGVGFSDQNGVFIPAVDSAALVSGDAMDGTFRQSLTVSAWAPPGTYSLMVSIRDMVGNRGFVTTEYFVTVTQ